MDILNMIMAQRYGANKKSSYLWLKADSNWGKTFLFEGILKGLGYTMTESELKNSVNGGASAISASAIVRSSFLHFDEVRGVVGAFKNIVSEMSVSEKFKARTTVDVYMKILCSAETLPSLSGEFGMEAQFANRFLYIEAKGSLLDRQMYMIDKGNYVKNVRLFALQQLHKLKDMYDGRGRVGAVKLADEIYTALIDKYTIKKHSQNITDVLPEKVRDWMLLVQEREGVINMAYTYRDCIRFTAKGIAHILNKDKAKQYFIEEYVGKSSQTMVNHKSFDEIFGKNIRSSVKINNKNHSSYKIL